MTWMPRYYEVFGLWERNHPETGEIYLSTHINKVPCYVIPNPNKLEPNQPDWLFVSRGRPDSVFKPGWMKFTKIFKRRVTLPIDEEKPLRIKL